MGFWDLFSSKPDQGSPPPKQQEQEVDLDSVFDDPLMSSAQEFEQPAQEPANQGLNLQQPSAPRMPDYNGLESQINQLDTEISTLSSKLANPAEHFKKEDGSIDATAFNAAQLQYTESSRRYNNLVSQRPVVFNQQNQQQGALQVQAQNFLKAKLGSLNVDKDTKAEIAKQFGAMYNGQVKRGVFNAPEMSTEQGRKGAFEMMLNLATGAVYNSKNSVSQDVSSGNFQPAPTGQQPQQKQVGFTEGSVAHQLYQEFMQGKQTKGLTVGQIQRMERERQQMEQQYNADPEGFKQRLRTDAELRSRYESLKSQVMPAIKPRGANDVSALNQRLQQNLAAMGGGLNE